MIGTSYLSVGTIRALAISLRQTVSTVLQMPGFIMPTGKTTLRAACDLSPAHAIDPTKVVTLTIERSTDGGNTWSPYGGAVMGGVVARTVPGMPYFQTEAPLAGHLLRTTLTVGASAVDVGAVLS